MKTINDCPVLSFSSFEEFEKWLDKNHAKSKGIWLRFFKKNSGTPTVTHDEALDCALCYGWIDGQLNKYDEKSYLHKFTPRRPKSLWSKRNINHIKRLIKCGKMKPGGLKQVVEAQKDGRWKSAYDSPGKATIPKYFLDALSKNKKAKTFFDTFNKTNRYAIIWRLQTAKKPETRDKRLKTILSMLSKGEKFHLF